MERTLRESAETKVRVLRKKLRALKAESTDKRHTVTQIVSQSGQPSSDQPGNVADDSVSGDEADIPKFDPLQQTEVRGNANDQSLLFTMVQPQLQARITTLNNSLEVIHPLSMPPGSHSMMSNTMEALIPGSDTPLNYSHVPLDNDYIPMTRDDFAVPTTDDSILYEPLLHRTE
jgi:hypothetical protein